MSVMRVVPVLISLVIMPVVAVAQTTATPCELQLTESTVHARNLTVDVTGKGEALAKQQVRSFLLEQKVAQLEKQIADLKKALEPKVEAAPKKE